jgi:bifunctional DNA-binding transcriptional regulator/antitoxin component of YhaV-PrlF toxin-antitoxin module
MGRALIPKELRRTADLLEGDQIEFLVQGTDIVIRKYNDTEITEDQVIDMLRKYGSQQIKKHNGADVYQVMIRVLEIYDKSCVEEEDVKEIFRTAIEEVYHDK